MYEYISLTRLTHSSYPLKSPSPKAGSELCAISQPTSTNRAAIAGTSRYSPRAKPAKDASVRQTRKTSNRLSPRPVSVPRVWRRKQRATTSHRTVLDASVTSSHYQPRPKSHSPGPPHQSPHPAKSLNRARQPLNPKSSGLSLRLRPRMPARRHPSVNPRSIATETTTCSSLQELHPHIRTTTPLLIASLA